jgi:hypothetical protein
MKKSLLGGALPILLIFAALSHQALLGMETVPTITIPLQGAYAVVHGSLRVSGEIGFNLPFPVNVAVRAQVQGAPPGTQFGVDVWPDNPACPKFYWKAQGHCFPSEFSSLTDFAIDEVMFRDNGRAYKLRALLNNCPDGEYVLNGQITVAFTRILSPLRAIRVTAPAANSVHAAGQALVIAWTSIGAVGASVKIRLVPQVEPQAAQVIVASTANDGAFSWTPATGFPGKVWIEVRSLDGKVIGKSGLFTIQPR